MDSRVKAMDRKWFAGAAVKAAGLTALAGYAGSVAIGMMSASQNGVALAPAMQSSLRVMGMAVATMAAAKLWEMREARLIKKLDERRSSEPAAARSKASPR